MHTLQQLQTGALVGATQIKIAEGLVEIPEALFELVDTLEVLDLSGNKLNSLPETFCKFTKLRIVFLSNNEFITFPKVLSLLPQLDIVGFKANAITHIPENAIPVSLRWLILTDNKIERLPDSIGDCVRLQKVMLAGNCLTALPDRMASCTNIELLRLSANKIESLPDWLFNLPRLAWLAFSNNVCTELSTQAIQQESLTHIPWSSLEMKEQLGQGASGIIYKAYWKEQNIFVAVKLYKGAVTSDGFPQDEMKACLHAGLHKHLPTVLGVLSHHPDGTEGLIMGLIDSSYHILGGPPDFDSCTRDTFGCDTQFSIAHIQKIMLGVTHVVAHLHQHGIMHGDLYAHNTLVNEKSNPLLSDFGAATMFNKEVVGVSAVMEHLEVRALGCLLDDLLQHVSHCDLQRSQTLTGLRDACLVLNRIERPSFDELIAVLNKEIE